MSSTRSTQFHTNKTSNCRFCKEKGHSVAVCTVLANNECGYCHQIGHTTRRCTVLSNNNVGRRQTFLDNRRTDRQKVKIDEDGWSKARTRGPRSGPRSGPRKIREIIHFSQFASLIDNESHSEQKMTVNQPTVVEPKPVKGVWSKQLEVQEPESKPVRETHQVSAQNKVQIFTRKPIPRGTRWADVADSDSDSD